MGAQLRVYKQKISSAQTTKKITKAMELIAASRIQKAMARVRASSPFARAVTRAVSAVATHSNVDHPLTVERETIRRSAVVIFSSDRGLAGAFNSQILREGLELAELLRQQGKEPVYYIFKDKTYIIYYFHYGWSDNPIPGIAGHEADWESIAVQLDDHNSPANGKIQYNQHHGSCTIPWSIAPLAHDRHPRIEVGLGSHASYAVGADTLVDDLSTQGKIWYANKNLQSAKAREWFGYGGIWGENGNAEDTSGPLGPGDARAYASGAEPPTFRSGRCDGF